MSFLHRHRRKLAWLLGFLGASYFGFVYVKAKIVELQSREGAKATGREKFEQNQQDACFTAIALVAAATDPILTSLPVEAITHELQARRTDTSSTTSDEQRSKKELWNDIKILSVTRAVSLAYALALLVFFTRLQLNLLGRQNYIQSVRLMADDAPDADVAVSNELNRRFLTFSWWLLSRGWQAVVSAVREAVEDVFGDYTPRTEITLTQLDGLVKRIQDTVDSRIKFLDVVLPTTKEQEKFVLSSNPSEFQSSPEMEAAIAPMLQSLLDEARDLTESPNAGTVIRSLVSESLKVLLSNIQVHLYYQDDAVKLASVLAGMARQSQEMAVGDSTNQYLLAMNNLADLTAFSAVVYSNYVL